MKEPKQMSTRVLITALLGILIANGSFHFFKAGSGDPYFAYNSKMSGTIDMSSKGTTTSVTLGNGEVYDINWETKIPEGNTKGGNEVYIIRQIKPKSGICAEACTALLNYETNVIADKDITEANLRQRLQNDFNAKMKLTNTTSAATGTGPNKISNISGIDYLVAYENGKAILSPEGKVCTDCYGGKLQFSIPEGKSFSELATYLRDKTEAELKNARNTRDGLFRETERERNDRSETADNRRKGDRMLSDIIADCRRDGKELDDANPRSRRRTTSRRDRDIEDIDSRSLSDAAATELECRAEAFSKIVSDSDNLKYIDKTKATKFFEKYIQEHLISGLLTDDGEGRTAALDIIRDLDMEVSDKYGVIRNKITSLSEQSIKVRGNSIRDRFQQAQKLAATNPQLAQQMMLLGRKEQGVLADMYGAMYNNRLSGLSSGRMGENLNASTYARILTEYQAKTGMAAQCALVGMGNCGNDGLVGLNQNFVNQNHLRTDSNLRYSSGVNIPGTTNSALTTKLQTVNSSFQPVRQGQQVLFRGITK